MQNYILEKLFNSIIELDQSVAKVQASFSSRNDIPENVNQRLGCYREICQKQRELWTELLTETDNNNKENIAKITVKINALSTFIIEDIRSALASLEGNFTQEECHFH